MRSTKATAAVERLKARSAHTGYAVVMVSGGLFYLTDRANGNAKLCEPLPLDHFVIFVNGFGPPKVERKSKLNDAFEAQIREAGQDSARDAEVVPSNGSSDPQ